MLITDQMKGALDTITESFYPGQHGKGGAEEFGEEILGIARGLCEGEGEHEEGKEGGKK